MMSATAKRAMMEWAPISKRIIKARFYLKYKKLTVIQAYSPTNDATDVVKDELYNQLKETLTTCNKHDMIVLIGDLNTKEEEYNNSSRDQVIERHNVEDMYDSGEKLCDVFSVMV